MADPMLSEREYDLMNVLKRLVKDVEAARLLRFSHSKQAAEMWQRVTWSVAQANAILKRIEPAPVAPEKGQVPK